MAPAYTGGAGQFRVWCPELGEDEGDASEYFNLGFDHEMAAEYWAEYDSGFDGDPWDSRKVLVRHGNDAPVELELTVHASPTFSAARVRAR